ncbi:MAG: hypothetical protein JXR96_02590, partial [Deltaproteobacteria bacterium]|nr:hypothetical protein [Deltaproteobacteria bacterium]
MDGDGQADSADALAALGMDEAERAQIAEQYEPGQRFIRLQLDHFSTYDVNWGFSLPQDAEGPSRAPAQGNGQHNCEQGGSVIDVQDQGLGEDMALVGLPFGLHYRSERMTGYGPAYGLRIPLRGPEAPASLKAIQVELDVAGRHFRLDFEPDPTPGQAYDFHDFVWDGRDAYGRMLQGAQPVKVRIGYIYGGVYQANERFGYSGNGADITASWTRQEIGLWLEWRGSMGAMDATGLGLGGLTLGVQHAYDPAGRVLYLGSGEKRSARELEPRIRSAAGGGQVGPLSWGPEGHPALDASIACSDVAVGPDGSLLVGSGDRIVRVDPAGVAHVVAGGGTDGDGEGIAARDAYIWNALSVGIDAQGTIYFADTWDHRVRKVGPDGKIHTLGGRSGEFGYEGDGGPVSGALFFEPRAVLAAKDGSVYIADRGNCVLRRVGADGLIYTVAGQPGAWSYEGQGDGGPAIEALLDQRVNDLAEGPDGSIYLLENSAGRVRRIDRSGIIDTVAGGGSELADGVSATDARIEYPESLAVGPDGSLYIETRFCIRKVGPDGLIRTLAGTG